MRISLKVTPIVWRYEHGMRAAVRAVKDLEWKLFHAPWTDEERLAFRWALDHVRRGRTDLAAEDLAWLGARL